jgi:putative oxidoreductase
MKYLILLARIFFSIIFILAGFGHFSSASIGYAASSGVPLASVFVPLSGVIALLGGLSIILGYKVKWTAWLLVIFLVPVTFTMHQFWAVSDPMMAAVQQAMFFKNISMIGAAILISYFGTGPLSVDEWLKTRDVQIQHA